MPQYKKAVVKSRFAEAFTNAKSIGQAQQVCRLETNSLCSLDDLSIDIEDNEYFRYETSPSPTNVLAAVLYEKEDVCLCYLDDGSFVLSQDHDAADCVGQEASLDYSKLLQIEDVGYDNCQCC